MRCSVLLPFTLVVSVSASLVLPLALSAGSQITRRQAGSCDTECSPVETQITGCATDLTCLCTATIAKGLQTCATCEYKADPTSADTLQTALDQYTSGCQASGHSVGSLTLSATGAASSTSARSSASVSSTSAITSISTPPAFATSSATASLPSATQSVVAGGSSSTSAALTNQPTVTSTGGLTGSGNGAAGVGVQMTGACLAAGIVAAFAVL
ncbi:hypothetical protein FRC04_011300 [Tulasnella sp. 424]|nr:hypothetical protein FRC04_011300 [Tulasnella sp. 424]